MGRLADLYLNHGDIKNGVKWPLHPLTFKRVQQTGFNKLHFSCVVGLPNPTLGRHIFSKACVASVFEASVSALAETAQKGNAEAAQATTTTTDWHRHQHSTPTLSANLHR